jgi:hypothetical protein
MNSLAKSLSENAYCYYVTTVVLPFLALEIEIATFNISSETTNPK